MNHHGQWLDPSLEVYRSEVRWYFVAYFYDLPISGLAHYEGRVVGFCWSQDDILNQQIFALHELSASELVEELRVKAKYEALVGTHSSFDEGGKPLSKELRAENSIQRFFLEEPQFPFVILDDRPIIAWFRLTG